MERVADSIPALVRSVPDHAAPPEPHKTLREEKSQQLKPGERNQFFKLTDKAKRIVH